MKPPLSKELLSRILTWQVDFFDSETKNEIKRLQNHPEELEDRFYKDLEFGTGGMRGVMGVGTNRINRYTLGKNTQGLSNYLKEFYPNENLKVAIAYDCRLNSKSFAKVVADVFSANEIEVFLFEELRHSGGSRLWCGPAGGAAVPVAGVRPDRGSASHCGAELRGWQA